MFKRTTDDAEHTQLKRFLFDPDLIAQTPNAEAAIQEAVNKVTDIGQIHLDYTPIELEYADWDVKRCIRAILPEKLEFRFVIRFPICKSKLLFVFSGHTQIGHIMHLNLREELMPYRFTLGRILLDKTHYAR